MELGSGKPPAGASWHYWRLTAVSAAACGVQGLRPQGPALRCRGDVGRKRSSPVPRRCEPELFPSIAHLLSESRHAGHPRFCDRATGFLGRGRLSARFPDAVTDAGCTLVAEHDSPDAVADSFGRPLALINRQQAFIDQRRLMAVGFNHVRIRLALQLPRGCFHIRGSSLHASCSSSKLLKGGKLENH